ncbi:chemotaxis protein CheC [Tundrisphaera sp. TA3]|uniref:chemotaxis protein CheC n=1 Tax=Tundrisphaera sp. TA3 TaxID=3435775 RepID=UPI003EBA3CDC
MSVLDDGSRHRLREIFERGAEQASAVLSRWLGRPATLRTSDVDEVDLAEATELLGPPDGLVVACSMELAGRISGHLLLVFGDRSGLALADMLLGQPAGTANSWGELERSAANETANVVGCAYLNSLAAHLPRSDNDPDGVDAAIQPSPPSFRHEFAGSLLEFALMDQALELDRLLLVKTRFESDDRDLDWSLLLVPSRGSLDWLARVMSAD